MATHSFEIEAHPNSNVVVEGHLSAKTDMILRNAVHQTFEKRATSLREPTQTYSQAATTFALIARVKKGSARAWKTDVEK